MEIKPEFSKLVLYEFIELLLTFSGSIFWIGCGCEC